MKKKKNYEKSSFWAGFKELHRISWSKDKVVVIPIMEEWETLTSLYKKLNNSGQELGREIFDSQIQFLGDWRRSGGTKNRNKDLLSRRRFARQRIRKIRKTNDSWCGAFYCVEYCDHPKSVFPGTTGNHWCQRGNAVTQLQKKNMTCRTSKGIFF